MKTTSTEIIGDGGQATMFGFFAPAFVVVSSLMAAGSGFVYLFSNL